MGSLSMGSLSMGSLSKYYYYYYYYYNAEEHLVFGNIQCQKSVQACTLLYQFSLLRAGELNRENNYGGYNYLKTQVADKCQMSTAVSRKAVRKKRTQQSRKVLWVVLSSRFLDYSISGKSEKMARDAMDVCLQVLKESNKSRFDSYSVRNVPCWSYPRLPFGIVACAFFRQRFSKQLYFSEVDWARSSEVRHYFYIDFGLVTYRSRN